MSAGIASINELDNVSSAAAAADERSPLLLLGQHKGTGMGTGTGTGTGDETSAANITTPTTTTNGGASSPRVSRSLKRRMVYLIYMLAFAIMFASYLQPAARSQLYEDAICRQYYASNPSAAHANAGLIPTPLASSLSSSSPSDPHVRPGVGIQDPIARCKVAPIQQEVALIRGYELIGQLLPILLLSLPYSILADRIGRRPVLALSLVGQICCDLWILAVCRWPDILPVRTIALSGLFMVIGGGPSIPSSMVHVMIADVADEAERTQIFMNIHAANVLSGFLAPVVSAVLMETGHVWAVCLLAEAIFVLGMVVLLPLLPETRQLKRKMQCASSEALASPAASTGKQPASILVELRAALAPLADMASNRQALLLMAIYMPILTAHEQFGIIGLVYVGNKFGVSYGRGNALLSLQRAVQAVVLLAILPAIGRAVMSSRVLRRPWSAWRRDRAFAIASLACLVLGHVVLGLSPTLVVAIVGLVLTALASASAATVLSLLGSAVGKDHVAAVYGAALSLSLLTLTGTAPLAGALLGVGMRIGWAWSGLPFLAVAALLLPALLGSCFVRRELDEDGLQEDEQES